MAEVAGRSVATDASGNVYVAGTTNTTVAGSADQSVGVNNILVGSWDRSGNLRWLRELAAPGENCIGTGIAVDRFGNVDVTGGAGGVLPGSDGPGGVVVASWDTTGRPRWVRQFGPEFSTGSAIAVDDSGDAFVAGTTQGSLADSPTQNSGGQDAFVASWESAGSDVGSVSSARPRPTRL